MEIQTVCFLCPDANAARRGSLLDEHDSVTANVAAE